MRTTRILNVIAGLLLLHLSHSNAWAGTATLSWNTPTTNADGSPLTNLAGYKVYYGIASATYTQVVDVGLTSSPATPSYIVNNLADGNTYYFVVTAYNTLGNQSGYSSQVAKTFPAVTTTTTTSTTTTTRPTTTTTTTTTSTTTTTRPTTTTTTTTSTTTTTRPTTTTTTTTSTTTTTRPTTTTTTTTTSTTTTTRPTTTTTTTTTSTTTTTRPTTTTTTSSTTTTTTVRPTTTTTTTTSTTTTTIISQDTTPPVIFAITATSITDTGAVIGWTTNEASTSLVEYGTTAAYGFITSLSSAVVIGHSKTIGGLQASTTYHYRISSADAAGNLAISGDNTFTTSEAPDTTPSIIFGISASNITRNDAVISWSTDEGATSQVEFGTTSSYGSSSVFDPALRLSHSQSIAGLLPNNLYHYRVRSADQAGNLSVSGDYVFTTGGPPDATPPGDVRNFRAIGGKQRVSLSWTGPSDLDFTGVRIRYRTDGFPADNNDGILLGDFTGLPDEIMTANHTGLQNGVTYYYSASSYDGSGNYQSTMHASATPSSSDSDDFSQTISGGCGMVFPTDGRPGGPGQAADMTGLLTAMLLLWIRRVIRNLKPQTFYHICPMGMSDYLR